MGYTNPLLIPLVLNFNKFLNLNFLIDVQEKFVANTRNVTYYCQTLLVVRKFFETPFLSKCYTNYTLKKAN